MLLGDNMKMIGISIVVLLVISAFAGSANLGPFEFIAKNNVPMTPEIANADDFDPLVDIEVTVEIQKIRSLVADTLLGPPVDKIDPFSDPDFYVKVFINDHEFTSPTWTNEKYVYDPQWSASLDVPDDIELVNITIQLWDSDLLGDKRCDISDNEESFPESFDVNLQYSIKSGHWFGDDYVFHEGFWGSPDPSGYGRLNGCDDNSVYQNNRDCEMWFDIYQNDYDDDGIPYWTEVEVFNTDPMTDNRGEDADDDGIPIEWEYKWGHYFWWNWRDDIIEHVWMYDPFSWDDHESMDDDEDGLDNVEEYMTSQWGSDPFRRDLFIELDEMEGSADGIAASVLPDQAKELLQTAYNKHNIVYHLDDGWMGGGELLPFVPHIRMF